MKIQLFPHESPNSKWSEFVIDCNEQTKPLMEEIIKTTSLIRVSDMQTIERILRKRLTVDTTNEVSV